MNTLHHLHRLVALAALAALASGCVVWSIQPFVAPDQALEQAPVQGKYRVLRDLDGDAADEQMPPWEFGAGELLTHDRAGSPGILQVTWFKVGEQLYADFSAGAIDDTQTPNGYWLSTVLPVHVLTRVDLAGDTATFTPLNPDYVQTFTGEQVPEGAVKLTALPIGKPAEDNRAYIVEPAVWQAWLAKHAAEPKAWNPERRIVLKKLE